MAISWRDICEFKSRPLRSFDAPFKEPLVRRPASCLFECSGEVTVRQTALTCQLRDEDVPVEVCVHSFLRAPFLPWRQAAAERPALNKGRRSAPSTCRSSVGPLFRHRDSRLLPISSPPQLQAEAQDERCRTDYTPLTITVKLRPRCTVLCNRETLGE